MNNFDKKNKKRRTLKGGEIEPDRAPTNIITQESKSATPETLEEVANNNMNEETFEQCISTHNTTIENANAEIKNAQEEIKNCNKKYKKGVLGMGDFLGFLGGKNSSKKKTKSNRYKNKTKSKKRKCKK